MPCQGRECLRLRLKHACIHKKGFWGRCQNPHSKVPVPLLPTIWFLFEVLLEKNRGLEASFPAWVPTWLAFSEWLSRARPVSSHGLCVSVRSEALATLWYQLYCWLHETHFPAMCKSWALLPWYTSGGRVNRWTLFQVLPPKRKLGSCHNAQLLNLNAIWGVTPECRHHERIWQMVKGF